MSSYFAIAARFLRTPIALALVSVPLFAHAQQENKIRILSSRSSATVVESASTAYEVSGQARAPAPPPPPKTSAPPAAAPAAPPPVPSATPRIGSEFRPFIPPDRAQVQSAPRPASNQPQNSATAPSGAASTPGDLQAERRRAMADRDARRQRALADITAPRSPRVYGVPQGNTPRPPVQSQTAAAASPPIVSTQPASPTSLLPPPPTAPVPGLAKPTADVLASEVTRSGDFYYFVGKLNGTPVRFKINDAVTGINVPFGIARRAKIVGDVVPSNLNASTEWISPIQSIMFGAHPMRAVMVKISTSSASEEIEIGLDSLAAFKVIEAAGGRRVLTPKSAPPPAASAASQPA